MIVEEDENLKDEREIKKIVNILEIRIDNVNANLKYNYTFWNCTSEELLGGIGIK